MSELLVEVDIGFETTELPIAYRPATPEEIKACIPRCGTCKHYLAYDLGLSINECDNNGSNWQPSDYCNHHEPKE